MSLAGMLIHTCSTQRTTAVGTNGRKSLTSYLSSVKCKARPMSPQASIQNGFEIGYGYTFIFQDGTDIQAGDRLIWNGVNYLVKGKPAPYAGGSLAYIKVLAESEHASGV
jgi:hypothetical protein